ncbi:MAG: hypothetical protein BHW48_00715 [Roseburia sp. CAG:10041_57]|nr:MAG: hypothetical protein BHW48_00715 [Roseburia sp. CAG:10041_57]
MNQLHIKKGQPYPLGASSIRSNAINFSMVNNSQDDCGIILYDKETQTQKRIPFDSSHRLGNICCMTIEGLTAESCEYNYYIGEQILTDTYAKRIYGNEKWGSETPDTILRGGIYQSQFDWQKTAPLHIPYQDSIFYCLHVRGFTRHSSSKAKHKGTFMGLIEKLPYLKQLGITAVELMPAYEFEECEYAQNIQSIAYQVEHIDANLDPDSTKDDVKINYWGFKNAFYFTPKSSYAATDDPCAEFKQMVREFHKNGIEVILQFYFPDQVKQGYILEVLKHWVLEYRIDGLHLIGNHVPVTLLATEPLFADTKLIGTDFALQEIYPDDTPPYYRNLGYCREEFMKDLRRFLKGDYDVLNGFCYHMRNYNMQCGVVNYITNYNGFTLADLVSYEHKHNEANGENNQDGTDYNYSWNCGIEGATRKRSILDLRRKQMRNAMCFLLMAQGTPMILAGDEFCNSQKGNNNCYCQDNDISWLDWRNVAKNEPFLDYVKALIQFRQKHSVLHADHELAMTDFNGNGYPELSYHGEDAWKIHSESCDRHVGMMYCEPLPVQKDKWDNDYIYIAYNMHWEAKSFALPTLPGNYTWNTVLDTQYPQFTAMPNAEPMLEKTKEIEVSPRSVKILCGQKIQMNKSSSRKRKKLDR